MAEAKPSNMKKSNVRNQAGFTRTELAVVVGIVVVLALLLLPHFLGGPRAYAKAVRISCLNNLKQLGIGYRTFANDNGDQYPAYAASTNGGWSELLTKTNVGAYAWVNYAAMADELGQSPKVVICSADERMPAGHFVSKGSVDYASDAGFRNNLQVSYFAGVVTNDEYPQSLLGGDRNLGPGTVPDPGYGYSPMNGQGNDVIIKGPVCWSLKMHSAGNVAGSWNILLGDGSGQQTTSASFNAQYLTNAMHPVKIDGTTNNQPGFRLIFP